MTRQLLNLGQVAGRLGYTADWMYRNRRRLENDHGFPPALAGFSDLRWDPVAIDCWLDRQLPKSLVPAGGASANEQQAIKPPRDWAAEAALNADRLAANGD